MAGIGRRHGGAGHRPRRRAVAGRRPELHRGPGRPARRAAPHRVPGGRTSSSRRRRPPWARPARRAASACPRASTRPRRCPPCGASAWRARCWTRASASRWWPWASSRRTCSSGEVGDTNLPDLLPADAIGFVGIGEFDVDALWGGLMEVLAQIPAEEGQGIDETLAMLGTMLGVDIESDIIGQLTGEIGVGLLPATAGEPGHRLGDQPRDHRRDGGARTRAPWPAPWSPWPRASAPCRAAPPLPRAPSTAARFTSSPDEDERHSAVRHGRGQHGDHHPREPRRRPARRGRPAGRVGPLCRGHQRPAPAAAR